MVNDFFGGRLLRGEVFTAAGEQAGFHWWNVLDSGVELDLTLEQFKSGQRVVGRDVVERPRPFPKRRKDEYLVLRERVAERLGWYPAV
ncbi:hypothetical protein FHU30_008448 [Actinomadura rupiterrae]|nr:hypothetical protein [Actinomadura rupiterrae]MCP2343056.1 hypothetical protein [Actinomadura rupiterrae]